MDVFGAFLDEDWEPLSKVFSMEDSDFMFVNNLFSPSPSDHAIIQSTNLSHFEQHNTTVQNHEGLMLPVFSDDVMEEILRKSGYAENVDSCSGMERKRKFDHTSESLKKKPRNGPKRSKKDVQIINNNASGNVCCSEEDNSNGGSDSILASNGKSKGPATDPQSIYARKRRERINERLRILQNLVPNGTKVDISTMLEEAVSYVKFLQLQIKLLSSDDLWMYAPIAYNGMDMGLYQKIDCSNSMASELI